MELVLTWDLLIIIFFAVVIAYSFIIGKHESVKIIVATYVAILAVQGLGNILERLSGESEPVLNVLGISLDITLLSTTKLILFVAAIILLAIRGGFQIEYTKESGGMLDVLLTGIFGFATAGLLLSTLFTYIAGADLLSSSIANAQALAPLMEQSTLMAVLVGNQDLWFSLPALLLIAVSFLGREGAE